MLSKISTIVNHHKFQRQPLPNYRLQNIYLNTNIGTTRTVNHWYAQVSASGDYVFVSTRTNPQGLLVSNNGGASFTQVINAVDTYNYVIMSTNAQYMYCTTNTRVYRSNNFGSSFTPITVSGAVTLNSCTCSENGQTVFCIDSSNGRIYRSTDFGLTYSLYYNYGISSMINIQLNESENTLYWNSTNNANNQVYRFNMTTSTITAWKPTLTNNCAWLAVSSNGQYMYAIYFGVTSNQLAISNNYGASWSVVNINTSKNNFNQIYCSPSGQFVYAVYAGLVSHFYSINYGASWTEFTTTGFNIVMNQYRNHLIQLNGSTLRLTWG